MASIRLEIDVPAERRYSRCDGFECVLQPLDRTGATVEGGAILGVLGAAVGTIVGAVWKAERWSRYAPTLGVRVGPSGGVSVGLAVPF